MIIRVFRAKVRAGRLQVWHQRVEEFSIPWLKKQKGMIGFYPGKPLSENSREYCMLSFWENVEDLKEAVGENWEQVVLLEDEASLVEETSVDHFKFFD